MDKWGLQKYIEENFDNIIECKIKDIKARIENGNVDDILIMSKDIDFINSYKGLNIKASSVYLKEVKECNPTE